MKAANSFLPGGRKPSEFKYFMFTESYAFKLLAPLVLQVAEVKLRWHCQNAVAARASPSVPEQADGSWSTQTPPPPAGAILPNQCDATKRGNEATKEDFSHNFR